MREKLAPIVAGFVGEVPSPAAGASLIGLIGLGSLCSRVLLGCIAEAIGSCRSAAICAMVMGIGCKLPTSWTLTPQRVSVSHGPALSGFARNPWELSPG